LCLSDIEFSFLPANLNFIGKGWFCTVDLSRPISELVTEEMLLEAQRLVDEQEKAQAAELDALEERIRLHTQVLQIN